MSFISMTSESLMFFLHINKIYVCLCLSVGHDRVRINKKIFKFDKIEVNYFQILLIGVAFYL